MLEVEGRSQKLQGNENNDDSNRFISILHHYIGLVVNQFELGKPN